MSVINFYEKTKTKAAINPHKDRHGFKVPFRALIAAPSGSGKTNALLNVLAAMDQTFHQILVCVKSADEPLYQLLADRLGPAVSFFENGEVPPIANYSVKCQKTGKLKRLDKLQRLIVFDDLVLDKGANKHALEYYIKARKLGFSMIYISQSYFQTPKMIRDNCQYFILGKNLLKKDLRMILHVFPTDMTLDQFAALYNDLTTEPLSTITIDIEGRTIRPNITGDPISL